MNPFKSASEMKAKTPIIVSLVGESSSGKTYSALRLATGLTNNPSEIFLIDTENRGAMYADIFGDYQVANVADYAVAMGRPTHRPQNYIELIDLAKANGAKVLIIDSLSDPWGGDGGCVSWAASLKEAYEKKYPGRQAGISVWALPKASYAEMMNKICNSNMNIIFTFRTKEIVDVQKDERGKTVVKQEKRTEIVRESGNKYNITWELYLDGNTKQIAKIGKTFDGGDWIFKPGELLTEEHAKRMLEWQNATKESVVRAGKQAKDRKAWFESLNPAEKRLATQFASEIKQQITEEDL